jgi:hypothetical protein
MLHITNGDHAAHTIQASGVPGRIIPWREVLHEGPVPGGISDAELGRVRARFIAGRGWATAEQAAAELAERDGWLAGAADQSEVVLWFEHDLYDQLELIQLLDWFAVHPVPRLTLVNPPEYLGPAAPGRLAVLFERRSTVTGEQLALGGRAWAAFRERTPRAMAALLDEDLAALPFLAASLRRLLEQLPGADDGLSRSERQILRGVEDGPRAAGELFQLHNAQEDPVWLGDAAFVEYLRGLAAEPRPLLHMRGGGDERWHQGAVSITGDGLAVLCGAEDAVALRGVDRWLGGVHLEGRAGVWRWDRAAGRVACR